MSSTCDAKRRPRFSAWATGKMGLPSAEMEENGFYRKTRNSFLYTVYLICLLRYTGAGYYLKLQIEAWHKYHQIKGIERDETEGHSILGHFQVKRLKKTGAQERRFKRKKMKQ